MALLIAGARLVGEEELLRQLGDVFEEWVTNDVNNDYMYEQFRTDKWSYAGPPTKRKSGDTAGNPRDIYDLGNLYKSGRDSFKVDRNPSKVEASWHWNAKNQSGDEYAWFVHEGEGPYSREPRPWTDEIAVPYLFYGSEPHKRLEQSITLKMGR